MIGKFLPYLRPHRRLVLWALVQVFLVAAVELLKPWPLQIVIDYVLGGKAPPAGPIGAALSLPPALLLLLACLGLVVVHFTAGGLTLLHNYTTI
jgi:ATP-binding cassette subfamily B protein